MTLRCFVPVVLVGYMWTIQTSWHHTTTMDAPMIEVQSCEVGLGMDIKAATSGLFGVGFQYGWKWEWAEHWSATFLPKAGLSHTLHQVYELPSQTQFEVGAQLLFGYDKLRLGVEYWHLSNAGFQQPNIGLDMIVLQTGWAF